MINPRFWSLFYTGVCILTQLVYKMGNVKKQKQQRTKQFYQNETGLLAYMSKVYQRQHSLVLLFDRARCICVPAGHVLLC